MLAGPVPMIRYADDGETKITTLTVAVTMDGHGMDLHTLAYSYTSRCEISSFLSFLYTTINTLATLVCLAGVMLVGGYYFFTEVKRM